MKGNRAYADSEGTLVLAEGEYGQDGDGLWWCRPPGCHMGALSDHQIEEHDDGTITVSPSIHLPGVWHGYLKRGVWSEC